MTIIQAGQALTTSGWQRDVSIRIDQQGRIAGVAATGDTSGPSDAEEPVIRVGALLPALSNVHSHAFQRAMAGMTEARGPGGRDSFWTWRTVMYRFVEQLTPDDIEAIAALVYMEMLEAGFASVGEFHYLHHQVDGQAYAHIAELAERIVSAARHTGLGLTLLPVLYEQGGCDGRALTGGQRRFGNDLDRFAALFCATEQVMGNAHPDADLGIAPHSLRAVSPASLSEVRQLSTGTPFHCHLAEQVAEVDEVSRVYGARPVQWLLDTQPVDEHWCLIHCTQMNPDETRALAASGAVAGLCPITESSLGDGIFDGVRYQQAGGKWAIGSDSNIRISCTEELRTLEYSQRLRDRERAVLASGSASTGRVLYDAALLGGAQALGRESGSIAVGHWADLVAYDTTRSEILWGDGDALLDGLLFAGDDSLVTDVWSAGRHMVQNGRHVAREPVVDAYRQSVARLMRAM